MTLKEARERKGLNQRELAEQTHMAQSLISDFERRVRKPYPKAVERLCQVLGASPSELFPEDGR